MAAVTKIPAGELKVGDHYARTKRDALDGKHTPITEIRDGETSRRLILETGGNVRPRRDTEVWVMLESDDDRLPQAPADEGQNGLGGERPSEKAMRLADEQEQADQVADREETDATLTRVRAELKQHRGVTIDTVALDGEQMARALELTAGDHEGLRGKAAKRYILDGTNGGDQARQAKAEREASTGRHTPRGPKPGSMTSAMLEVMKPMRTPATAKQVTEKILSKNLAPGLKGKTPDATVGAKLSTEAAKPDGLFERVAPGKYKIRAGR